VILPGGRRLTLTAWALALLAAAGAVRLALSGDLAPAVAFAPGEAPRNAGPGDGARRARAAALVEAGRRAQARGDLAGALACFREAVLLDGRLAERGAPGALGPAFEEDVRRWVKAIRAGTLAVPPAAAEDASFLFRRLFGGCG